MWPKILVSVAVELIPAVAKYLAAVLTRRAAHKERHGKRIKDVHTQIVKLRGGGNDDERQA